MRRVITLLILLLATISCTEKQKEKKVKYVKVQKVTHSDGMQTRIFAGITQAGVESKISFRVSGTLVDLPVKIGDQVQKGDVIARLEPSDFRLQVEETQASLMQAKAKERHAGVTYSRMRELYETRSTSRNELDSARATAESAQASVEALQKKLALTTAQMGYTTLYAPESGSIASVNVEINENVKEGAPIVKLNYGSTIEVSIAIPEIYIARIYNGDKVDVTLDSFPGKSFTGVVSEVGVATHVGTTFPVTVTLDDKVEGLRSGMTADVAFTFESEKDKRGVFVPSAAVIGQKGTHFVFLAKKNLPEGYVVRKQEVKVGELTNLGIEVLSGVDINDLIVTAGLHSLTDGMEVKVIE